MTHLFSFARRAPAEVLTKPTRFQARPRRSVSILLEVGTLEARVLLTAIPELNSLLGAPASLYLDFDGHYEPQWGAYKDIYIPPFDQDGNPSSFSASEIATISRIWEYVAEDFAPFNINVTTVEPPSFDNGVAMRIAIGGDGAWLGGTYSGFAYVNSFTNSIPNVAFVFPKNLANGNAKYTGDVASHEAGHTFGLRHQSLYDSDGNRVQQYYSGPGDGTAPLMGNSLSARRSLWWYGTTTSATTYQDDMAVIASATNGFGYRPDDHGGTAATATPLNVSDALVSGAGIIERMDDIDVFSFTTGTGTVSLTVNPAPIVNNLAPRLDLYDATGTVLIASAGPSGSNFSASITTELAGGSYRLFVSSNGGYGNVGQYWVNGTIVPPADLVHAPTNLAAQAVSTSRINLSWNDNATNETGYRVERSLDGQSWTVLANALPANSTSYADTTAAAGTTYFYRVQAYNSAMASDYSNQAGATTIPSAPTGLSASAQSASRVELNWNGVKGASSYRVERSLDGLNWTVAGTTGANVTTFEDSNLSSNTTYTYRVQAINASGASEYSNFASATTFEAPSIPQAPSQLTGVLNSAHQVELNWRDNSDTEDGFRVERSHNGGKAWSTIAELGPNRTSYVDADVSPRKTYSYRVVAFNVSGDSSPSNVVTVSIPANGGGNGNKGNGGFKSNNGNGKGGGPSAGPVIPQADSLAFAFGSTATTLGWNPSTPLLLLWNDPAATRVIQVGWTGGHQPGTSSEGGSPSSLVDELLETWSPRGPRR